MVSFRQRCLAGPGRVRYGARGADKIGSSDLQPWVGEAWTIAAGRSPICERWN